MPYTPSLVVVCLCHFELQMLNSPQMLTTLLTVTAAKGNGEQRQRARQLIVPSDSLSPMTTGIIKFCGANTYSFLVMCFRIQRLIFFSKEGLSSLL